MDLMNNDDYILINPYISLTANNMQFPEDLPVISSAIESNYLNDNHSSNIALDHKN